MSLVPISRVSDLFGEIGDLDGPLSYLYGLKSGLLKTLDGAAYGEERRRTCIEEGDEVIRALVCHGRQ